MWEDAVIPWGILAAFKCREAEPEQCLNMSVCCRVYISALSLASEEKRLSKKCKQMCPFACHCAGKWLLWCHITSGTCSSLNTKGTGECALCGLLVDTIVGATRLCVMNRDEVVEAKVTEGGGGIFKLVTSLQMFENLCAELMLRPLNTWKAGFDIDGKYFSWENSCSAYLLWQSKLELQDLLFCCSWVLYFSFPLCSTQGASAASSVQFSPLWRWHSELLGRRVLCIKSTWLN